MDLFVSRIGYKEDIFKSPRKQNISKGIRTMTQSLNGIIFDFNGTLFLDNDKHVKAWSKVAKEIRGTEITEEELFNHMNGMPNKMIVRYLNGGKENAELEEKYSSLKEEYYRDFCREDVEHFHLITGAETLFDELLASGIPFTIASASIKPNIDFFVESFNLDRWIKPENIVYDDGTYENKIAMIHKAADILGLSEEKITVIEDSTSGINSAIQAGIQDIRLLNSANIAHQVSHIEEIRQVVRNMSEIHLEFLG